MDINDKVKNSVIYVRTHAYNAESFIGRAIDSIINQTHQNWIYYICNNGSKDKTGDIIDEYASRDSRIRVFHNKENFVFTPETREFDMLVYNLPDDVYFCILDADDEYKPWFMEKSLKFLKNNDLDFVITSNEAVTIDGQKIIRKNYKNNVVINDKNFEDYAKEIISETVYWSKLYKGNLLRKFEKPKINMSVGLDVYTVAEYARLSTRIGILSDICYTYYIHGENFSRSKSIFKQERLYEAKQIYEKHLQLVTEKIGIISQEIYDEINRNFCIHFTFMVGSLTVASNNPIIKFNYLTEILFNKDLGYDLEVFKNTTENANNFDITKRNLLLLYNSIEKFVSNRKKLLSVKNKLSKIF